MPARALVTALLLSLAGACVQPRPNAASPPAAEAESAEDRPLVVVIHAEWCASCRHAAPAVAWLREEYGDRVTFVDLDVTDDDAVTRSAKKASSLGLGPFFEQNRGTPGVVVLARGRRTVRRFGPEYRAAPYRTAVEEALASFPAVSARLPITVSVSADPVAVYGVQCLSRTSSTDHVCAVIVDETETATSDPRSAMAMEAIHGSTVSMMRWFTPPEASPKRAFTITGQGGSRVVTSESKVILVSQSSPYGGAQRSPIRPVEGNVGYVVDAPGMRDARAVAGAHTNVRYIDATGYWDSPDSPSDPHPSSPDDREWQRANTNLRSLIRAEFRDEFPGGYRVAGHLEARLEKRDEHTQRCISFNYSVGKTLRATFPCERTGPPRGILLLDGVATWVFTERWGR